MIRQHAGVDKPITAELAARQGRMRGENEDAVARVERRTSSKGEWRCGERHHSSRLRRGLVMPLGDDAWELSRSRDVSRDQTEGGDGQRLAALVSHSAAASLRTRPCQVLFIVREALVMYRRRCGRAEVAGIIAIPSSAAGFYALNEPRDMRRWARQRRRCRCSVQRPRSASLLEVPHSERVTDPFPAHSRT